MDIATMVIFPLHEDVCTTVLQHGSRQGEAEGYRKSQASAYQYVFHLGKDVAYCKKLTEAYIGWAALEGRTEANPMQGRVL